MKSGNLGELAAQLEFAKMGYEIYSPAVDNTTFDFLLHRDGLIESVEVKTTSTRNLRDTGWVVQLKSVRSNKTQNNIRNFDNTKMDYLVVYIQPMDKIFIFKFSEISNKTTITIFD